MKASDLYNLLNEYLQNCKDGHAGSIAVNSLGELLERSKSLNLEQIESMLAQPIPDDFFDIPFEYPFTEQISSAIHQECYYMRSSQKEDLSFSEKEHFLNKGGTAEQKLLELIDKIREKQKELVDTLNENTLREKYIDCLGKRYGVLFRAHQILTSEINLLQERERKPGFFDKSDNLQFKINLLNDVQACIVNQKKLYDDEFKQVDDKKGKTVSFTDCRKFLRDSETVLSTVYHDAHQKMSNEHVNMHANPIMKFIDWVFQLLSLGFVKILTKTESTVESTKDLIQQEFKN